MIILFDEDLAGIYIDSLFEKIRELGFTASGHTCKVNRSTIDISELSNWANLIMDKILLITNKRIVKKQTLDFQAAYSGIVDSIRGKIGVVTIDDLNKKLWTYIALHEILHLYGAKHCESRGCIMSYMMCNCMLKYCVACETSCKELVICDQCRGVINA